MSSRRTRVRSKIAALLVSLAALWAFAAYVTVQAGLNLLWINNLDTGVGRPTDALVTALQTERRLSVQYLGSGRELPRRELEEARASTDAARTALEQSAATGSVRWAADDAFEQRIDDLLDSLGGLPGLRAQVDAGGATDRASTAAGYTAVIDTAFHLYDQLGQYASEISEGGRTVVGLSRAREILAQEDAMMTGVLEARTFAGDEPLAFASIVAVRRAFYAEAVARLSTEDRAGYDAVANGGAFREFQALEDEAIRAGRAGAPPSFTQLEWRQGIEPVLTELRRVENDLANVILERATPAAVGILIRLALAGGLGLVAVVASIVVSVTTARRLVRQLERLRTAAEELAAYRLPRVVERLQHGERVDVAIEAPPLEFGRDEIGRLGHAFNAVQSTAIQTAVDQAELRRSVRDVFLSLARRSQALLHRQLSLLDAMERRATDADDLAELFRVDHLATRMRRNAENLIVLSGASAGRAWRRPVPMIDVIRGALAEVEDYTRVTVTPVGNAALIGRGVGDVIHLLAELIENAVSFSPPQTIVRVGGSLVGNGYVIEIEDRGLGMGTEDLLEANAQLRNPPEFKLSSTARLGLYVVAKLAERHGIKVQLSESSYGGTTAVVLLPAALIAGGVEIDEDGAHRPDTEDGNGLRPSQLAVVGTGRTVPGAGGTAAGRSEPLLGPADPATEQTHHENPPPLTPSGLPYRQRPPSPDEGRVAHGRSAAPGGAVPGGVIPAEAQYDAADAGSPELDRRREGMRRQLSSFRSGTARGRNEAARLTQPELEAPEWTESPTHGTNEHHGRTDA